MPVTIKTASMKYKDPESGEYFGIDAVAETTTAEQVAAIEAAGQDERDAIEQKGEDTLASIPSDYTALSGQVGELKSAIESIADTEYVESTNLLNPSDVVEGWKLDNTAGLPSIENEDSFTSGFISVEEGKTYNWLYQGLTSRSMARVCAYDESKAFLSTYTQDSVTGYTIAASSGIKYIRFSSAKSRLTQNAMFTEGIPESYEAYFAPYYDSSIKNSALDMDYIKGEVLDDGAVSKSMLDSTLQETIDSVPDIQGDISDIEGDISNIDDDIDDLNTIVSNISEVEHIKPINLLNYSDPDFANDTKLSNSTGLPTENVGSFSTGYIPVEEGKTYNWLYIGLVARTITRVCAYDSSKTFLSTYTQDAQTGYTVPSSSGIKYVRFSGSNTRIPPTLTDGMFAEGVPDHYEAYFVPYDIYAVKQPSERIYPEWVLGTFDNNWRASDSTQIIRSDYIAVAHQLDVTVPTGFTAKIYPFDINAGKIGSDPITVTDTATITDDDAAYVRITYTKTSAETIVDPNVYGLGITVKRAGYQETYQTILSANPNLPDANPARIYPGYLAMVAIKEKYEAGKMSTTIGYLFRTVTAPFKLYYADGKPENVKYLCDWDTSIAGAHSDPIYWCFAISHEGDIICVHRGELEGSALARANPIVYPHTDYAHPQLVELGTEKPTSWLSNCGVFCESGHVWFGEYIRYNHDHANVWDVSAPYINAANWVVSKSYDRDTDPSDPSSMVPGKIEHIHCVARDPFSGILYVSTGDRYTEARIDYLQSGTWSNLREADEEVCRQLNFIFTPEYVYWANDAFSVYDPDTQEYIYDMHKFFRVKRTASGLLDLDNLESYRIPYLNDSIVTYHTAYIKDPECIVILDRHDAAAAYFEMPFRVWNVEKERLEFAGLMKQVRGNVNQYLGFRCECCQHYPNLYDSTVYAGFSMNPNSIDVCGNPCPAINPSVGGLTTDDSVNTNQVNAMSLRVKKN